MVSKKLTIIINTFRSEDKINQCLNSIDQSFEVIVVENSQNISFKKKIENNFKNVRCILAGENLGYAKGNNLGLSKVKSEYALILNPDALLQKDTIKNFFITAEKFPDFSIIGPAKQDEHHDQVSLEKEKQVFEVDNLKGFALFLNLEQFNDVGFFDENFFIYLEEIDLCKRLRQKNKKIYLDKKIIINHLGGSSHNKSINFEMELSRNWHWMWSKFYYNKKHYGYLNSLFKISGNFFSSVLRIIFYSILFNNKRKSVYIKRLSGIVNSIIGKKSWYRPNVITN